MFSKDRKLFIVRFALTLVLLAGALGATATSPVLAATLTVTTTSNSGPGSLRQAITNAASGDTIVFAPALAGRTIALSSSVILNRKKLVLDGSGLSPQVTISGGGTSGFIFNGLSTMDIYDLTISNFNTQLAFRTDTTIRNSTLKNFTGNALYSYASASLTVVNSTLEGNQGLAILAYGSATTITNSVLRNNAEGGIRTSGSGSLTITNSTLSGNGGDAIKANGPAVVIVDSTLMGNQGRAILSNASSLSLINTTIYQDSSYEALTINAGQQATIVNSTILTQTQGSAPGIFVNGDANIDIFNSTIVANTNRVLFLNFATFDVYNSILMCTHQNECLYSTGTINEVNSIVGSNGTLAEYGLSELADNGGPTQTMALTWGSSLIDAGDDAACANVPVNNLDQRGVTRPQGTHCDIGAYEYDGDMAQTVTSVLTLPNPSQVGQAVTTAVIVASESGTPTGTVDVSMDGNVVCTLTLVEGTGTCNIIFNTVGTIPVTAVYSGDPQYLASTGMSLHDVLAVYPTPTFTAIPTDTPTPFYTPTFTPTITSTPVLSCNSIRDSVGMLVVAGKTMYLDIPNSNPYPVTIAGVRVGWNYANGHRGANSSLRLLGAALNGTTFWTGDENIPIFQIPLPTNPLVIPANGTSRITFTFDQTYDRLIDESLYITFSTAGCESYPIDVTVAVEE